MGLRMGKELSEEDTIEYDRLIELSNNCDRNQHVKKIQLNSAYGALCNEFFRFFDLRLGASTTGTGQELLRHQTAKANELLTGKYDFEGESIVGGDTDSTYFKTFADDIETAEKVGDAVGKKVNESFPKFMRDTFFCSNGYDHHIQTDREVIASRSIFIKKKLYIMRLVNIEGKKCDKIKAMGVSLKKSTLPKEYQLKLTEYIERLLKGEDWKIISKDIVKYKQELSEIDNILRIGLPKGVKGIIKYTNDYNFQVKNVENFRQGMSYKMKYDNNIDSETGEYKLGKERYNVNGEEDKNGYYNIKGKPISIDPWKARLPGHVAASILWNIMLEKYDDKESIKISSGTKIKVYYLTKKIAAKFKDSSYQSNKDLLDSEYEDSEDIEKQFTSIAIPTDTKKIPKWFISEYKNLIDIDAQLFRLIDKSLEQIITPANLEVPSVQGLLLDDLLTF
jgi:hypothetical protein